MSGRIKPGTVASGRVSGQRAVENTSHLLYSAAAPIAQSKAVFFTEPVGRRSRFWARLGIITSSSKQPLIDAVCRTAEGCGPAVMLVMKQAGGEVLQTLVGMAVGVGPRLAETDPLFRDPRGRAHQRGCSQRNDSAGVGRDG